MENMVLYNEVIPHVPVVNKSFTAEECVFLVSYIFDTIYSVLAMSLI